MWICTHFPCSNRRSERKSGGPWEKTGSYSDIMGFGDLYSWEMAIAYIHWYQISL